MDHEQPVRAGLQGLADGSLLQNFALAAALARLTLAPVDYAAAALAAGDEEGRERPHAALGAWPAGLRQRVALAAEEASALAGGTELEGFARRTVSRPPARVSINSAPICLRNSDSESHQPRSKAGAKALSSAIPAIRHSRHWGWFSKVRAAIGEG